MATISKHAEIRFNQLFSQGIDKEYQLQRKKFEDEVLFKGLTPSVPKSRLLDLNNLKHLISRCLENKIPIYGIENSLDSNHPLFVEVKEDYTQDEDNQNWVWNAVKFLESNGITTHLFITYEIPRWQLEKYK